MRAPLDRLFGRTSATPRKATLGRDFRVLEEEWRLTDDPKAVRPLASPLASRKTAAEAADIARAAAEAYLRHGFDKASGAWWGADGERIHRFRVQVGPGRSAAAGLLLVSGLAGLTIAVIAHRRASGRRATEG